MLACAFGSGLGTRFPGLRAVAGLAAGLKLGWSRPRVVLPSPESVFCWNALGLAAGGEAAERMTWGVGQGIRVYL